MDEKSSYPPFPKVSFGQALGIGLAAGFAGVAALTVSNKLEQLITHRPNSYVPGHTTGNLLGLSRDRHPDVLNHFHHWGTGIIAGPVRALMSYYGIIGPFASYVFTFIRLGLDQTLENTAGTSAPPWTWPINEQVIDLLHKGIYALVTGYITDRLVRGVTYFNNSDW
ncbi:hypothetical protein W97_00351 [Coniosporium apollinis CBS 100218]|uniref:Uncharacterized protein n=1 Tax=Coniosporium apollinis (strain CBS 100218) TaxID=1168221 RepID=R7YGW8_CONA1|nr:uncharacterized protein W97_00351 [Coniosporium apollinis CBS 100218]EON61140.1 hypothetical protein W97_00351 [Coniosporium apollinis CBS 100218]